MAHGGEYYSYGLGFVPCFFPSIAVVWIVFIERDCLLKVELLGGVLPDRTNCSPQKVYRILILVPSIKPAIKTVTEISSQVR